MSLATREQKAVMTDFAGDGTFWFFSVMKRTYRKSWRKYKRTIKVEYCCEYNDEREREFPQSLQVNQKMNRYIFLS